MELLSLYKQKCQNLDLAEINSHITLYSCLSCNNLAQIWTEIFEYFGLGKVGQILESAYVLCKKYFCLGTDL